MQFEFIHQQPADSTTTPADYNQIIPLLQHSNEHYKSVNFNTTPWSTIIKLPSLQSVYLSNGTSGQNYKTCRPQGATLSAATRSVTYVLFLYTVALYSWSIMVITNYIYPIYSSPLNVLGCIGGTRTQNLYPHSGTVDCKDTKAMHQKPHTNCNPLLPCSRCSPCSQSPTV
jgi:hypothetical protein